MFTGMNSVPQYPFSHSPLTSFHSSSILSSHFIYSFLLSSFSLSSSFHLHIGVSILNHSISSQYIPSPSITTLLSSLSPSLSSSLLLLKRKGNHSLTHQWILSLNLSSLTISSLIWRRMFESNGVMNQILLFFSFTERERERERDCECVESVCRLQ